LKKREEGPHLVKGAGGGGWGVNKGYNLSDPIRKGVQILPRPGGSIGGKRR